MDSETNPINRFQVLHIINLMHLYLSSFKLGSDPSKLKNLLPNNAKAVYISNALDFAKPENQARRQNEDMDELKQLELNPELLDLRDYFNKETKLRSKLQDIDLIYVSGGNVYDLRQAIQLSGFDTILKELQSTNKIYAAYSAGVCVLSPTLKGYETVDSPDNKTYGDYETIWEGLGLIDWQFTPHFDSDHPESEDVNKEIAYYEERGMKYKALRDGEVIVL